MRRDYGKKKSSPKPWPFALVVVAFTCGYLLASLSPLPQISAWIKAQMQPSSPSKPQVVNVSLPKPKFEFYTTLAKDNSVLVPVKDAVVIKKASLVEKKPIEKSIVLPASTLEKMGPFWLQMASFHNQREAERMKASLVLKGFNVRLMKVAQQQNTWYRVMIGPYASRHQAEKIQLTVARNEHIKGMIRKMDT